MTRGQEVSVTKQCCSRCDPAYAVSALVCPVGWADKLSVRTVWNPLPGVPEEDCNYLGDRAQVSLEIIYPVRVFTLLLSFCFVFLFL